MKTRTSLIAMLFVLILLLVACASPPSEEIIRETIRAHFEARGYRVIAIEIGDVAALGLDEKTYMGTEAYIVGVRSIRLEMLRDVGPPWNYRQGEVITAQHATIAIKRNSSQQSGWTVGAVSGIPVR